MGLSGHGGKYSCLFCDGDKTNLGELRTFNMLKNTYKNFAKSRFKKSSMQLYKNVIHPCLLVESEEMYVLDVIPPPELHLLMKIITEISNVLCKEPDVAFWLKKHGIIWHGIMEVDWMVEMLTKYGSFCQIWENLAKASVS